MRFVFVILLTLLSGCAEKHFEQKIIGTWVIYSIDGKTDLYKAFAGTSTTFTADGTYSRSHNSKTYGEGKYHVDGDILTVEKRNKKHRTKINIKGSELHIEKDPSFTSGGKPRKTVYKKSNE